jgi:hypothetical protein
MSLLNECIARRSNEADVCRSVASAIGLDGTAEKVTLLIDGQRGAGVLAVPLPVDELVRTGRDTPYDTRQDRLMAVSFAAQVRPGCFECALNESLACHTGLTLAAEHCGNDDTGCLAWSARGALQREPNSLLKSG